MAQKCILVEAQKCTLDYIKEWNLSTPWDLSTATFHQNSGELMTNPYSLFLANTNVGVATTAVTGTRGALGISTSSHGVGDNVDAYYLSQTTVLDEAGSGSIDSVTTTLSLDTSSGITTGSGKYLSIDNELISLSGASITDNTISNVTRGQLGTNSTTHLDEAEVKYLVEYTGVATIHTAIGTGVTTILITTSEDLSSKINTGGFIRIDSSEFVGVTTLFTGGDVIPIDNKMFVLDNYHDNIRTYTLNTNNDVRSMDGILQADSELGNSNYDILGAIAISTDGTKFFVADWDNRDRLTEFTLSTPYELSSATRTGNFISFETGTDESRMHFSEDGRKIYMGGGDESRCTYT